MLGLHPSPYPNATHRRRVSVVGPVRPGSALGEGLGARLPLCSPQPSHTSHHQAVTGQGARLVKAAHFHLAGEGDPERLCAVHVWWRTGPGVRRSLQAPTCSVQCPTSHSALTELRQGDEGGVNSQGQLNGQLRGHNRGKDEGTLQKELVPVPAGVLSPCGDRVW